MQIPYVAKRTVILFLSLHAAVITMLVVVAQRGGMPFGLPLPMFGCVALAVAITLYTAARIVQNVNSELASRYNKLAQDSSALRTASANLSQYAQELERTANIMQARNTEFERHADKMHELVRTITTLDNDVETREPEISDAIGGNQE